MSTRNGIFGGLIHHRELLWALVKRDFIGRYKGSVMGIAWSLFHPLLMLAIYTFVFSVAFKVKWGAGEESKIAFSIMLFSGFIVHSFFAECINRASGLITNHPNYVKKIIFPLEILPWMVLFSAILHFLVSFGVLLAFCLLTGVSIHGGTLLTPIILLPLILTTLGLSWIFSSLGVYLRDLSQATGMLTTVALFLAPIFYPIEALPQNYQTLITLNPITLPIYQLREAMFWNTPLRWDLWALSLIVGAIISYIGYWWFQKSRRGFADVL
jgi:lipopolysaccharide transport system permease protein